MAFFYNTPKLCTKKMVNMRDVVDNQPAFNAMFQINTAISNACDLDTQGQLRWEKFIVDGAINCGGDQTELDFFEKNFTGGTKKVGATEVYVRYNCDKDFNIFASSTGGVSAGPGAAVTFTLLRGMHAGGGKWSNVAVNGSIYIYEDHQWLRVTAVDKTTDWAHRVTAIPFSKNYTANVRGGRKMMFTRVRLVDGYSCSVPSSSFDAPGYASKVVPFRPRADWEMELELDKPYQDKLRFALTYDLHGNVTDGWEPMMKIRARQEFQYNKNLQFFMGQPIDNPLLIGSGLAMRDSKYSGFNGYLSTMLYGGGFVQQTNPTEGYDMGSDFEALMIRQDSIKQSTEFFTIAGFPWLVAMNRKSGKYFKENAQITFDTFSRSGMSQEDVKKLHITSYKYFDFSLHFKRFNAISDTRSIGNYNMPYMAFMMPGNGLKDENGDSVSAIEFYDVGGTARTGAYEEIQRDHRYLDSGCEKLSGTITDTYMMAVHCPQKHILLYPKYQF